jgi:hypothetical protein
MVENLATDDLPVNLAGTWQLVRLCSGRDHIMLRVTMPITGDEAHVTFSAEGLARLKVGLQRAGLDTRFFAWPPESDPDRSPYRGLRPLEAEDAGIFFGRDAPIVEALDRLRGLRDAAPPRLLVVLGASGAGKSSFLRAGIQPRLQRDDRNFLVLPVLRPERAAINGETGLLRSLQEAIRAQHRTHTRAETRAAIASGAKTLLPLLAELAEKAKPSGPSGETRVKPPTLVLAIDQGEEPFLPEGVIEAELLLALLREMLTAAEPGLIVVFTMRSVPTSSCRTEKALDGVRQRTFSLPPLPRGAYQSVIEGPVERLKDGPRAFKIEPALTQALLADIEVSGGRDALPLLAFTLERLYLEWLCPKRQPSLRLNGQRPDFMGKRLITAYPSRSRGLLIIHACQRLLVTRTIHPATNRRRLSRVITATGCSAPGGHGPVTALLPGGSVNVWTIRWPVTQRATNGSQLGRICWLSQALPVTITISASVVTNDQPRSAAPTRPRSSAAIE